MMIDARAAQQATVYYLGLAELVEARLAASPKYKYAVDGLDAAWRWVEQRDISGAALADMFYDEEGFGVGASMAVEKNTDLLPVWGCVAMGVVFAALAASLAEGKSPNQIREDIYGVDSDESVQDFSDWFSSIIPLESVTDKYRMALDGLPEEDIARSSVRGLAFAALHAAATHD